MTSSLRYLLFCLLLTTLVGCQGTSVTSDESTTVERRADETVVESSKTEKPEREVSDDGMPKDKVPASEGPITAALTPGTYCYQLRTEIKDIDTRITVEANDRVTGKLQGVVHSEAQGYYTSYRQKLDGTINGSNLDLDVATWIEYDKQNAQETWRVSANSLTIDDRDTLSEAECSEVNKAFQNEAGLEAEDLTASAQNVRTKQVSFAPGKSSTMVSDAVVRGDRDVYILNAQGGQQMYLSITAAEDNAVFDVVTPSGIILGQEMTQDKFFLPHTGDYQVIVGGTRGNASYDLAIAIE